MIESEQRHYAVQLIENPLWEELARQLEETLARNWLAEEDPERRETLWHRAQAVGDIMFLIRQILEKQQEEPAAKSGKTAGSS